MNDQSHSGVPGLVSLLLALAGLWAGAHPTAPLVGLLTQHQSEAREVLTYLLTVGGMVGSALAHPPSWLRARLARAWATLRSLATWGVA